MPGTDLHSALRVIRGADHVPGLEPDLRWAWLTLGLSALVAVGYFVIAFKWYFRSKVTGAGVSDAAIRRLSGIVLCCAGLGLWFTLADMSWPAWRVYDAVLALLAVHTWWFALRTRGVGLVNERLAQVGELEAAANRYREIAELLPHIIWTATAGGAVDFANRRWADFAGGQGTWLDAVHPHERDTVADWWEHVVRGRAPASREIRLGGLGGYRTFVVSATPIVHGDAVKWLGACADVEDQKRLAAEKELQARQKTFFLNSLSHDLRAPLNNVVLNAHLLKMSARDDAQLESATIIVDNAIAAGELVTKLLQCAKGDGQDPNAADTVRLGPMLQQIARRFQPIAEQKGLYLKVVADRDVELTTDRQKLERVVTNLLDNAIKFTRQGGVSLELAPHEVGESGAGRQGAARIRVADTGIGIPEESAAFLFDEFYQVDNHERDRTKGFGMGLAICRSLARQIGGDVRLDRTRPVGSCFELVLDGGRDARGPAHGAGGGGRSVREAGDPSDPEAVGLRGL